MSNRAIKKLRHRSDFKPLPSFKERSERGVKGEVVCMGCREFVKREEIVVGTKRCEKCRDNTNEVAQ